jgi:cell division protein FtsB
VLTVLGFVTWVLFFDQNSFIDRVSLFRNIKTLEQEKERLVNEIDKNRENINELQSSNENLEKFAREVYFMKKPDEDLFIIIHE